MPRRKTVLSERLRKKRIEEAARSSAAGRAAATGVPTQNIAQPPTRIASGVADPATGRTLPGTAQDITDLSPAEQQRIRIANALAGRQARENLLQQEINTATLRAAGITPPAETPTQQPARSGPTPAVSPPGASPQTSAQGGGVAQQASFLPQRQPNAFEVGVSNFISGRTTLPFLDLPKKDIDKFTDYLEAKTLAETSLGPNGVLAALRAVGSALGVAQSFSSSIAKTTFALGGKLSGQTSRLRQELTTADAVLSVQLASIKDTVQLLETGAISLEEADFLISQYENEITAQAQAISWANYNEALTYIAGGDDTVARFNQAQTTVSRIRANLALAAQQGQLARAQATIGVNNGSPA